MGSHKKSFKARGHFCLESDVIAFENLASNM